MNNIHHDIFRAIHEGKWLKIEYKNKKEEVTKYWIGIRSLNAAKRTLAVEGLHLGRYTTDSYDIIYIDSIISSQIVEGSYCPVNQNLVQDIYLNPHKYKVLFDNIANLKILNYLEMCNRMDTTPYYSDFELVKFLDGDSFQGESYQLSTEQFQTIVKNFQYKMDEKEQKSGKLVIQQLALNVLSIHTNRGLYVLAYKKLQLDVKNKILRPDDEITVCTEFYLGETKESIRKYLDAEEYELLKDFEKNQEQIKDCVTRHANQVMGVDDMPYIIGLGMEVVLDLHSEYRAIIDMYSEGKATIPIKAFFGELLKPSIRRKEYPITLIDKRINLDQLLAINNAMKYPIAYIQGPPGTGKTNTIINTIVTAFFNERTVLFASYNNHPINSVFEKLRNMEYKGKKIPFPVLRLGNQDKVKEAIEYIKKVYAQVKEVTVYESTLDKNKDDRSERAKKLSDLLKKYEDVLDFKERRETLNRMLEYQRRMKASLEMVPFQSDLQGRQLNQVQEKIGELGETTDEEALALLDNNLEELYKYLFYTSARYIKRLGEEKYKELRDILFEEEGEKQAADFGRYLSNTSNVKKLQKIFPVIITTCISAHKLGEPKPVFDMVIIDEASQCNTAVSLVPIIRGENLMLVGDPQQLNPVILLDELTNQKLRKKYNVADEYDYRANSIYKTFLACDAVSDEVLLHNHYRCNRKIIEFNNKKYYNSKLKICSDSKEQNPLVLINVKSNRSDAKNTADGEVEEIVRYACQNKDKTIGVITPFVNQRKLIEQAVQREKLQNVACGTVHAFQGDEKDVVLFSMALTDQTQAGTYEWLKNNKELINVATSRARDKLILLLDEDNLARLHQKDSEDDLFELIQYVKEKGESQVTPKHANSRALGVKPFSTATEEAFLGNLNHALENIWLSQSRYSVQKEVAISQVFEDNINYSDLFYSGRFDFVVYERQGRDNIPILAIELDGKEHFEDEVVQNRDRKKNEICRAHNLQIIRVENSYARRYNHIKEILLNYFSIRH
ncbi:MAG: AAA domain-containing protein [Bacteroidales bacterium]|nr:AAA domain-containing protein [Lachnoclostridium sp.]MCM1384425.1 AAA domain-containing protein [Lachnoclostridium sp.]MCM1465205.1 AAA domain-containing protein [Bacteroidales bacterium]